MKLRKKLFTVVFVFFSLFSVCANSQISEETSVEEKEVCKPNSPRVNCSFLPLEFIDCEDLVDNEGNQTKHTQKGYGCLRFGGQRYEEVEIGKAKCKALKGIECCGKREFFRDGFPCVKYSHHYFVTTLIYSILLGFLGMDRFCLGHTGTAVVKLLTLGGVGIWWIVDIVLLVAGYLTPKDGSNWNPNV